MQTQQLYNAMMGLYGIAILQKESRYHIIDCTIQPVGYHVSIAKLNNVADLFHRATRFLHAIHYQSIPFLFRQAHSRILSFITFL